MGDPLFRKKNELRLEMTEEMRGKLVAKPDGTIKIPTDEEREKQRLGSPGIGKLKVTPLPAVRPEKLIAKQDGVRIIPDYGKPVVIGGRQPATYAELLKKEKKGKNKA